MTGSAVSFSATTDKWSDPGAGKHYEDGRWSSRRHRERDPRRITGLLSRHPPEVEAGWILDAPCGTARLGATLLPHAAHYVGLDLSSAMLREGSVTAGAFLRGDLGRLPFRDGSFGTVVCCRMLHHLANEQALGEIVSELVRVSADRVVVSFWDNASAPEWRRWLQPKEARRRVAYSKNTLRRTFENAGADVVDFTHSFRFVSRQAYALARKRRRA